MMASTLSQGHIAWRDEDPQQPVLFSCEHQGARVTEAVIMGVNLNKINFDDVLVVDFQKDMFEDCSYFPFMPWVMSTAAA